MGCGSSSPDAAPHSVGTTYPKQQYNSNKPTRQHQPIRNNFYNDDDLTDDILPEVVKVTEKKEDPPTPKPTPVVTEKTENTQPTPKVKDTEDVPAAVKEDLPPPPPPLEPTSKVKDTEEDLPPPPPPPEPTPKPKETEDKVIAAEPVGPPTSEDVNEIEEKTMGNVTSQKVTTSVMGRTNTVLDTRPGASSRSTTPCPRVEPGELWTDDSFTCSIAFEEQKDLQWKRPGEFAPNPCLFADGTERFDIGQGSVGTCWFLSIVSAIADREDIMKQVIPEGAYKIGTPQYDGVFHCRFWKFGEWVDIYIDDCLPIKSGTNRLWASYSTTDENEMWVPLLEKAFAKFQGSYIKAEGGWAGDAFIYLTGGMAERLEAKNFKPKVFHSRLRNALTSGSVIACSVPESKDGQKGLVGGHAYTLTGTTMVNLKQGNQMALFRVRNPWGGEKGEWTGDFSDKSPKWKEVDGETKERLEMRRKGDGEFWMPLPDYYKYFTDTHLCNYTPDFDKDGKEDNLDKTTCIFGEWKGPTAAGKEIEEKMKNQKFTFTVPNKNMESNGKLPVVLQFMQHREHRKSDVKFYIRADLYKIEAQFKKPKLTFVLDELTNMLTFWGGNSLCYRYCLEPGEYLIVPTTMEPRKEKEFLIRLFASTNLVCKEVKDLPSVFIRRYETTNTINGDIIVTDKLQHFPGMWQAGQNAGGQIKHKSFERNPQYAVTVSGKMDAHVMVSLKQELFPEKDAIGLKIYKVDKAAMKLLDTNFMWRNYNDAVTTVTGENTFIHSYECAALFCLRPGNYVIIIFLETPDKETRYVLTLGTAKNADIKVKAMNIVT